MSYAIIQNNLIISYPASISSLQTLHPNTSFPNDIGLLSVEDNEYGIVEVFEVETPAYNGATQKVVEMDPVLINGAWCKSWQIVELTQDELRRRCDYLLFWDLLLVSNVYQNIRSQACQNLSVNTCCTEFIAAISDAKYGRPNKDAIQMCIWLLLQAATLTENDIDELQSMMNQSNLSSVYTLTQS
jgi:hypothetical protein